MDIDLSGTKKGHFDNKGKGVGGEVVNGVMMAVCISLTYPAEYFKVRCILDYQGTVENIGQTARSVFRRNNGFGYHFIRYAAVDRLGIALDSIIKGVFLQGMEFSGFYRRAMADMSPFILSFGFLAYLEALKIDSIMRMTTDTSTPSWRKSYTSSSNKWRASTLSSLSACSFFILERSISELLRKKRFEKIIDSSYRTYDRTSIPEKIITSILASAFSYPIEFMRVVLIQKKIDNLISETVPSLFSRISELKEAHMRIGLRGYMLPLLPYTLGNMIFIIGYSKFNSFTRSLK